jgi:hypothetical protein
MTKYVSNDMSGVLDGAMQDMANGGVNGGRLRGDRHVFTADGVKFTTSDTLSLGKRKAGDFPIGVILSASANLSAASIAIGNASSSAKYMAAATLPNSTSTFVPFKSTALDDPVLTATEEMIATISGATIPAGALVIIPVYMGK